MIAQAEGVQSKQVVPPHLQVLFTVPFAKWLLQLKDWQGRSRIMDRIDRLAVGNPGDSRSVGGGIVELRIDVGTGYRFYYVVRGVAFTTVL